MNSTFLSILPTKIGDIGVEFVSTRLDVHKSELKALCEARAKEGLILAAPEHLHVLYEDIGDTPGNITLAYPDEGAQCWVNTKGGLTYFDEEAAAYIEDSSSVNVTRAEAVFVKIHFPLSSVV